MSNENINVSRSFGVNLWWTIPGFVKDVAETQSLLITHGFEKEDIRAPSDRVEVSRAVRSFQNRRTKEDRRLAEVASTRGDSVVYGILDRSVSGDQVSFEQGTTVTYDKNSNTVNVTGALSDAVHKALTGYKDKITDEDIRYFLRRLVTLCRGVSKRPTGGIYFVLDQYAAVIEQAAEFLRDLNVGARLYVERVVDGAQEREIVREAVEMDIDKQLEEVMAGVDRVERRVSALKNGENRVEELRELMGVYQTLLGQEAKYEELTSKLDAAVQTISEKMSKLQGETLATSKVSDDDKITVVGMSTTDFGAAVKAVLVAAAKPMAMDEIVGQINANGFVGNKPKVIAGYFNYRVKNLELVRVSRGVYALPQFVPAVVPVESQSLLNMAIAS